MPEHPRHPPVTLKLEILHRCFKLREDVKLVSEETRNSRASIYSWRRKYIWEGTLALLNEKDVPRGKLTEGSLYSTTEIELLKEHIQDMQMEIDIFKKTIHVLKKTLASTRPP